MEEGEAELEPMAMAYKVLAYPNLGMCLNLGSTYTRAELETRCGRNHPYRRQMLHMKLKDRKLFKPVSLQTALSVKKVHVKPASSRPTWARAPATQRTDDDVKEVGRRRLVADGLAAQMLRNAGHDGAIRDSEVLSCLRAWGFHRNEARQNVIPEGKSFVLSDTLGLNRGRDGRTVLTSLSRRYPNVTKLLMRWFHHNKPGSIDEDFPCTSISMNSSYAARRHRDRNNSGPSLLKTLGRFTGGSLRYWPRDEGKDKVENLNQADSIVLNAKKEAVAFDGKRAHEVTVFQGKERFSLVFFTLGKYWEASPQAEQKCKELGFSWPTSASLSRAMSNLP